MSEINVAKLVSSFRFAVDQKSVQEIDKLLKKYSKTKIEIGTKATNLNRKEEESARALTKAELGRFNAVKFVNNAKKEQIKLAEQELRVANKARQAELAHESKLNSMRRANAVRGLTYKDPMLGSMGSYYRGLEKSSAKELAAAQRYNASIQAAKRRQAVAELTSYNPTLKSMSDYYKGVEKSSAKSYAASQRANASMQSARIRQTVAGLTSRDPELKAMGSYYREQEKKSLREHTEALKENAKYDKQRAATKKQQLADTQKELDLIAKFDRQYGKKGYTFANGQAAPNIRGRVYNRYFGERSATGNMVGSNRTFGGTYHGVMAGGGILTGFGLSALNDRLKRLEAAPMGIQAGANLTRPQAMKHMNYISGLAQEVGATRLDLVPSYTQFLTAATGTPLEKTAQESFRHFTRYGKALNLDPQQMIGGLKAIRQVTSKQRLYAEEIMGQLGEHFPGAVGTLKQIAGDVYGKDKDFFKMMEKGELDPNVLLPLLARAMGAKADTIDEQRRGSIDFAQGKARFAFESLLMKFGEGGGNSAFRDFYNTLSTTLPKMEGLFTSLAGAASTVVTAIGFIGQGLQDLSDSRMTLESSFTGIAIAAAMLGTKLGRAFMPLTAVFLLLEDLAMYKSGKGGSLIGYLSGEEDAKLEAARLANVPNSIRKNYSADPYSENFNPEIPAWKKFVLMHTEFPLVKDARAWLAEKYVGESGIKLTPDTQMDFLANEYLKYGAGIDFEKGLPSNQNTTVNITIDGVKQKLEQDRNNAGSFFINFGR